MYQFIIIDDGIGWTLSPIGFDCINRVHFFILNILNSRYSPDICPIYFGNLIVFDFAHVGGIIFLSNVIMIFENVFAGM